MKARVDFENIKALNKSPLGRIIVLTGARQTGKTTVARHCFPQYDYLSIENPVERSELLALRTAEWNKIYPFAILDEIQLEPQLFNSIKATYDTFSEPKYLLLGSSQFLLLQKVRESLAGRCVIREMFPLTLPELKTGKFDEKIENSFFVDFVRKEKDIDSLLPSFGFDRQFVDKKSAYVFYLKFGGYPALTDENLSDNERYEWLKNYVKTFLERDIRDLASFRDLEPFVKLQLYLANTTGMLANFSSVAKETGVSVPTVQRYVQYMSISYQSILLPAWASNPLKKLVKSPKIHLLDIGILRAVLQKRGVLSGNEYESAIVAEIYKQININQLPLRCYHLRTQDGKEIDLLLEGEDYFIAIEIKATENANKTDVRNFWELQKILNKPLKHCFLLSNDNQKKSFGENITALHTAAFLG